MNTSDPIKLEADIDLVIADLTKWINGEENLVESSNNILTEPEIVSEPEKVLIPEKPFVACEQNEKRNKKSKKSRRFRIWKVVCYVTILLLFNVVLIYGMCGGNRNLPGFAMFSILSQSMQDTIPQDSLIFTLKTDAEYIQIGDIITFYREGEQETITHKVVEIQGNAIPGGKPSFRTQGTMNQLPDEELVSERDLVGKVAFHVPVIGGVLYFIGKNLILTLIIISVLIAAFILVAGIKR
jgi:signal peptidase I, archaeal type